MRGEPLHLCVEHVPMVWYTGPACPYCAALTELTALRAELAALKAIVAQATAARPAP